MYYHLRWWTNFFYSQGNARNKNDQADTPWKNEMERIYGTFEGLLYSRVFNLFDGDLNRRRNVVDSFKPKQFLSMIRQCHFSIIPLFRVLLCASAWPGQFKNWQRCLPFRINFVEELHQIFSVLVERCWILLFDCCISVHQFDQFCNKKVYRAIIGDGMESNHCSVVTLRHPAQVHSISLTHMSLAVIACHRLSSSPVNICHCLSA